MLLVFALMVAPRPAEDCLADVGVHELKMHCASNFEKSTHILML